MNVYVIVADCGLNGPDALAAYTTEQAAEHALATTYAHYYGGTGYQGLEIYEIELDPAGA